MPEARAAHVARPAIVAAALFAPCACVVRGGLVRGEPFGDVHYYATLAEKMFAGAFPYRSLFLEYPPGSVPAILLPNLFGGDHYQFVFRLEMVALAFVAIGSAFVCLELVGATARRRWFVAAAIGLLPLALGPVLLNWFDWSPTALMMIALVLLLAQRSTASGVVVGLGAATKIFPGLLLALLPLASVDVVRRRVLAAAALTSLAVCLPFVVLGPGGVRFSVSLQAKRGLEFESLGGSVLLAFAHVRTALRPPGSRDLVGSLPDAVAAASSFVQIAALVATFLAIRRARPSGETMLVGAAALVAAFVAFGKVVSPQYLVWLVPLVPLASPPATVLLAAAAVLTQLWVLTTLTPLVGADVYALLARNVLLVAIWVVLLRLLLAARAAGAAADDPPRAERLQLQRQSGAHFDTGQSEGGRASC